MMQFRLLAWAMLFITGILLFTLRPLFAAENTMALVGATVFKTPEAEPIENASIIISDGTIIEVGPASEIALNDNIKTLNLTGMYITAGFWNSHVHYTGKLQQAALQDNNTLSTLLSDTFLSRGFVNTVDTGSWLTQTLRIRDRIESGNINGPKIIIAGGSFVPVGGSPFYIKPIELPELKTQQQTGDMVNQALNQGADAIKLFTGSWATPEKVVLMKADHIRAATTAAHEKNALVFAHPSDSEGARLAIENGVDILAHTFPSQLKGPWDRQLIKLMHENNVSLVPTLKLWRLELEGAGLPAHIVDLIEHTAVEQTQLMHEQGIPILFGTDVGYIEDANTADEFRLMAQAGMNYKEILKSLTTVPAARYGLENTSGKIAPGYDADLVILGSDPQENSLAFTDVIKTIRGGKFVFEK